MKRNTLFLVKVSQGPHFSKGRTYRAESARLAACKALGVKATAGVPPSGLGPVGFCYFGDNTKYGRSAKYSEWQTGREAWVTPLENQL